ncbi:hypothetical protein BDN72DRAFT_905231 [Pluteus cervinus]|uniref:Uncharacterized protein n=1 Tax=Pluteus cervinus TaxID=181527 RepID=A0ACD3A387_9AGAR|nr:hypothetical protein BDN72DRAFT_905231 [Pluteus cervinus]
MSPPTSEPMPCLCPDDLATLHHSMEEANSYIRRTRAGLAALLVTLKYLEQIFARAQNSSNAALAQLDLAVELKKAIDDIQAAEDTADKKASASGQGLPTSVAAHNHAASANGEAATPIATSSNTASSSATTPSIPQPVLNPYPPLNFIYEGLPAGHGPPIELQPPYAKKRKPSPESGDTIETIHAMLNRIPADILDEDGIVLFPRIRSVVLKDVN